MTFLDHVLPIHIPILTPEADIAMGWIPWLKVMAFPWKMPVTSLLLVQGAGLLHPDRPIVYADLVPVPGGVVFRAHRLYLFTSLTRTDTNELQASLQK
jgi:hypothetical protein